MLAHVATAAVQGVEPVPVTVEVNLATGLPSFAVVGLPQGSVREGRERVAAALRNSGHPVPPRRVTVNLAPGDLRKEGTGFDLPIAVGLLGASGVVGIDSLGGHAFVGELGLDGALKPVRGILPMVSAFADSGQKAVIVPSGNACEAGVVGGITVFGAPFLQAVISHLTGGPQLERVAVNPLRILADHDVNVPDMSDVRGQGLAKRALEIAAAGSHNVLFVGPPGSGKTMLARRLPGILPPLSVTEALEATRVHSVAGILPKEAALVSRRPFRAPHHTISDAGLVGGGAPLRPGEASLAHNGVLFLDELAEYRRNVLDVLRQPIEEGHVRISRVRGAARFPARFLMAAAMNPCPCGYWGDGTGRCLCDPAQVRRYVGRVSGPLMDRIDLHVHVPPVPFERLAQEPEEETSHAIRSRVVAARRTQEHRFRHAGSAVANGHMGIGELRVWCRPSPEVAHLLQLAVDRLRLSARSYHRILKVARTIADLAGEPELTPRHAREALQFRYLDRDIT